MGTLRLIGDDREGDAHILRISTEPSIRKYIPTAVKRALNLEKLQFEDHICYQKVGISAEYGHCQDMKHKNRNCHLNGLSVALLGNESIKKHEEGVLDC